MNISKTSVVWFGGCLLIAGFLFGVPAGGYFANQMYNCLEVGKFAAKQVDYTITGCQIRVANGTWMGVQDYIDEEIVRMDKIITQTKKVINLFEQEIEREKLRLKNKMVAI